MQPAGIHHLTAISAKPRENLAFYTGLLGMRLVKKTVNQDDVSAYRLFYADGKANPRHRSHLLRFSGGSRAAWNQRDFTHGVARRRRSQSRLLAGSPEESRRRHRRGDRGRRPADTAVRGRRG